MLVRCLYTPLKADRGPRAVVLQKRWVRIPPIGIMTYISPGRVTEGRYLSGSNFRDLSIQLLPGEVLVGLYDRGPFKVAPTLKTATEFEEFDRQYREGWFVSAWYYAMKL